MIADHLHAGIAELHQNLRDAGTVGGRWPCSLGQSLRRSIMRDGLLSGAMLLRNIARENPICEGRTNILCLLKMVRQQFRLCRADVAVVEILQHGRDFSGDRCAGDS